MLSAICMEINNNYVAFRKLRKLTASSIVDDNDTHSKLHLMWSSNDHANDMLVLCSLYAESWRTVAVVIWLAWESTST